MKFTLGAGRSIQRDGAPFIEVHRETPRHGLPSCSPVEADCAVRGFVAMYEALEAFVDAYEGNPQVSKTLFKRAREALALARGGRP